MLIAMQGPAVELLLQGLPCDLDHLRQFSVDWNSHTDVSSCCLFSFGSNRTEREKIWNS